MIWVGLGILAAVLWCAATLERMLPHITKQNAETNRLLSQIKTEIQNANERLSRISSNTDQLRASEFDDD